MQEQDRQAHSWTHSRQATGLYDEERVNFVRPKKIVIKKREKKTTQKIKTVKY